MIGVNTRVKFNITGPWSERAIFMAEAGSSAYGTRTPDSDQDYRGVFLATKDQIFGLGKCEVHTEESPHDLQMFELRHFAMLCLKGSPGQIEMLFYPEEVIIGDSEEFRRLWGIRHLFLSKRLKGTLGGFAQSDIKRIAGNNTGKSGAKGKLLIEKFGYNTKHAANAFRLLKMSETLFTTGELVVRPPESIRDEIRAIKNGKYSKDEFLQFIKDEDQRIFDLADKSSLPKDPDFNLIQNAVIEIYQNATY